MNQELQDNNYIIVDNFIDASEANNLYKFFKQEVLTKPDLFVLDPQCPKSFSIYNYRPFLILLCNKVKFMSELMNEPMLPTYSYARLYQKGEVLKPHRDRPSCEISVTLHLGGDAPWDIWFTKPNADKVYCNLEPGQAAVYQGMVSEHGRGEFKGSNYGQVFLHYVKANGEHWNNFFDRLVLREIDIHNG